MSEQENEQIHDQDSEPSLNAPGDAPPSGVVADDDNDEDDAEDDGAETQGTE